MIKNYHQIIILLLLAVFVAGCASTPTSTATQISTQTDVTSTQTAQPATATSTSQIIEATATEEVTPEPTQEISNVMETNTMNITIGDRVLTATLAENSSVDALKQALSAGPITVDMRDYANMEKVGSLGMNLPTNDQQITTEAGDIILYQGGALVIYYAPNSWSFTRLGKIDNITAQELKAILGGGNVTVVLSLP